MVLPRNSMLVLADSFCCCLIGEGEMVQKAGAHKNAITQICSPEEGWRGRVRVVHLAIHALLTLPFPLHPLTPPPLHQLVARARRLVVFYCVLCGPVHRDGPDQAAAADFKEIYEVSDAAMTTERHERGINAASLSILYIHI